MGSVMLGGRPTNQTLGPMQQMKILIAAAQYRAPTPRRAGKGKPLPPSEYEGEMETDQRKKTQKEVQRLILPKCSNESPDMFIRRLDAHKNAPEALVPPMRPPEDESCFIKRCASFAHLLFALSRCARVNALLLSAVSPTLSCNKQALPSRRRPRCPTT